MVDDGVINILRDRRIQLCLTQRDVADEMGYGTTQSMVSEWETGQTSPTLKRLKRWAYVLECTIVVVLED